MFRPLLARQFGKPSGIPGLLMGKLLNYTNAYVNEVTLELMSIQPTDHVLDVGFGGGLMLRYIMERTPQGFAAGIEISAPMLKQARRTFKEAITAGKLEIQEANVVNIPYANDCFDKICTVNTIHFWSEPMVGLREIQRVLKNKGLFVVAIRPKDFLEKIAFTRYGFAAFEEEEMKHLLEMAGFCRVWVKRRADKHMGAVFALATKDESLN